MANFKKYKGSNAWIEIDHDSRDNTETKENIDHSRTHLNYNLCDVENAKEYLKEWIKKAKESGATIRDDTNLICSLIVTLPEDFPHNKELKRQFFIAAVELIAEDFGRDRIISAWVHCDENKKNEKRPNKEHIHIKFAPVREKIKKYKDGREKTVFSFDAKNCVNLNYLKTFHKRLDKHLEDWLGFKTSVINGATKAIGGNKTTKELEAISEQQRKYDEEINKDPYLVLAKQYDKVDEWWQEYKRITKGFWPLWQMKKSEVSNYIYELKRGIQGTEKQLKDCLDFMGNLSEGFFYALYKLICGICLYSRKSELEKELKTLEDNKKEIDGIRRSFSNYQHNTKEKLKNSDLDNIEDMIKRFEDTAMRLNKMVFNEMRPFYEENKKRKEPIKKEEMDLLL